MNPKIEKATAFLKARGTNSIAFKPFFVRVEQGMNGSIVDAVIFSKDREISYAKVEVTEHIPLPEESGPNYRVRVSYPAQNGAPINLRHTYLAAAIAAVDLAEAVDAHLRSGM
jgi:hypothetical protein